MPTLRECGKLETFPASVRARATSCGMVFPLSLRQFMANPCCPVDSMTPLLISGPAGLKLNIVIIGDGFAAGDQLAYNKFVQEEVMEGIFARDYFYEDKLAFNIYRINLISHDSGVTEQVWNDNGTPNDASDDILVSTIARDTALDYVYNGSWSHCWVNRGTHSDARIAAAIAAWVPDCDLQLILLNNPGGGGCGGGGRQTVTIAERWPTIAHEFGHGTGHLEDEYCRNQTYTGGEPGINATLDTNRATLKWGRYVDPATPVPTGITPAMGIGCSPYNQGVQPANWSDDQDVGLFEGAVHFNRGVYRPVVNCRMVSNSPPYCPVCYSEMKRIMRPHSGHTFERCYAGDFDGDGRDGLLVHNGNGVHIFRSDGSQLDLAFSSVEIPGWPFRPNDRFIVGDFNGDGKAEVVVFNNADWLVPTLGFLVDDGHDGLTAAARYDGLLLGWQFGVHDRFLVADFDGDGVQDLVAYNGEDWPVRRLALIGSGSSNLTVRALHEDSIGAWSFRASDRFIPGDFTGDGKDDLYVFNGSDWVMPYLGMLSSDGSGLALEERYDGVLPGGWTMHVDDMHYAADFDGDGRKDLYVFNGTGWAMSHLAMLRSSGSNLQAWCRYDGNAPGWQMRAHDRHWVADIDGDGREDLYVYNHSDWASEYLGKMLSTGVGLNCTSANDWVGEWNLGPTDQFEPCNYQGAAGKGNLFVHNTDWFGMIQAMPGLSLQRIYKNWIHNYRFGRHW